MIADEIRSQSRWGHEINAALRRAQNPHTHKHTDSCTKFITHYVIRLWKLPIDVFIFISYGGISISARHFHRMLTVNGVQKAPSPIRIVVQCRNRIKWMKNSHRTPKYFSDRISNARNRERVSSIAKKTKENCRRKKEKKKKEKRQAKMSFYSIERGWSLSYTVFPDHHRRRGHRHRWLPARVCFLLAHHWTLFIEFWNT